MATKKSSRAVYIVDGSRTPFLKARGVPGPFTASDLAVNSGRQLLSRQPFDPAEFDEVIPTKHAYNLAAAFPPDQLVVEILLDASHNTISDQPRYMQILDEFF